MPDDEHSPRDRLFVALLAGVLLAGMVLEAAVDIRDYGRRRLRSTASG